MFKRIIHNLFMIFLIGNVLWTWCELQDFSLCHEDYELDPKDGVLEHFTFPWLGIIYYIHENTKRVYANKAPRVTLVQKQFAIAVATDVVNLPEGHKLGNVIFGDYEQDEDECKLSEQDIRQGVRCPRAVFEVPIIEVLTNPEYSRFHVMYSLALVKLITPVKSSYAIPVCLPSIIQRRRLIGKVNVSLIDYISKVPMDFQAERIGKKTLRLYTHVYCFHLMSTVNPTFKNKKNMTHMLCTTGCGIRPGAPITHRSTSGRFELVGLATGGPPCLSHDMRNDLNTDPPIFVDVYPYVTWIINLITAHYIPKAYPHNFRTSNGIKSFLSLRDSPMDKCKWLGRQVMCGVCTGNIVVKNKVRLFYMEKFSLSAKVQSAAFELSLEVSAGIETTIECVRLKMSTKLSTVNIVGMGAFNITVFMKTKVVPPTLIFTIFLYGRNATLEEYLERYPLKKVVFPDI